MRPKHTLIRRESNFGWLHWVILTILFILYTPAAFAAPVSSFTAAADSLQIEIDPKDKKVIDTDTAMAEIKAIKTCINAADDISEEPTDPLAGWRFRQLKMIRVCLTQKASNICFVEINDCSAIRLHIYDLYIDKSISVLSTNKKKKALLVNLKRSWHHFSSISLKSDYSFLESKTLPAIAADPEITFYTEYYKIFILSQLLSYMVN